MLVCRIMGEQGDLGIDLDTHVKEESVELLYTESIDDGTALYAEHELTVDDSVISGDDYSGQPDGISIVTAGEYEEDVSTEGQHVHGYIDASNLSVADAASLDRQQLVFNLSYPGMGQYVLPEMVFNMFFLVSVQLLVITYLQHTQTAKFLLRG